MRPLPAIASLLLVAGLVALLPSVACAQEQDPVDDRSPVQRLLDQADSAGTAQPDSVSASPETDPTAAAAAAAAAAARHWWDPLVPTLDARVTSDLSRVVFNGGIEAPVGEFTRGGGGRARFAGTDTSYRRSDRDARATNFNLDLNGPAQGFGEYDVEVLRNTSYDENRIAGVGTSPDKVLILEHDVREIHATLAGSRGLARGLRAAWGVRGDVEDVQRSDKGVAIDRTMLGAAVTGLWGSQGPWHDLSVRYGYDRRQGERLLRDEIGDATTERDTLWTRGTIDFGQQLNIDLDARRTTFVEDRLDFARDANGVVDTLNILLPVVGDEHESTWQNSWNFDLRSRPFPRLALNGSASQAYTESSYTFSREGLVQLGRNEAMGETVLRYAAAGSLRVRYTRSDRYNDRRARGAEEFRGDETRLSQRVDAEFRQKASDMIDIHFDLQQSLDQNINENPNNQTDRDRLVTRTDLALLSEPWEWFDVEVAGAYSIEEEINIDGERVNSNQVSDLYEVRGNFTLDPEGGWRFIQNYRVQIRIIDRLVGIENDKFNKQGQWDSRIEYLFRNGIFTDAQYIVDYRRNGDRDEDYPDDEVYVYRGARRDHRVTLGARIPIGVAELDLRTERGFLRDDSPNVPVEEDRGKLNIGVRGNWPFWNNRGTLTLNASRVLQFGPRVSEINQDYWIMNTSLRVAF